VADIGRGCEGMSRVCTNVLDHGIFRASEHAHAIGRAGVVGCLVVGCCWVGGGGVGGGGGWGGGWGGVGGGGGGGCGVRVGGGLWGVGRGGTVGGGRRGEWSVWSCNMGCGRSGLIRGSDAGSRGMRWVHHPRGWVCRAEVGGAVGAAGVAGSCGGGGERGGDNGEKGWGQPARTRGGWGGRGDTV